MNIWLYSGWRGFWSQQIRLKNVKINNVTKLRYNSKNTDKKTLLFLLHALI